VSPVKTYRFNVTISAVRADSSVTQLTPGSEVVIPDAAEPDSKGMTGGNIRRKPDHSLPQDLDQRAECFTAVRVR